MGCAFHEFTSVSMFCDFYAFYDFVALLCFSVRHLLYHFILYIYPYHQSYSHTIHTSTIETPAFAEHKPIIRELSQIKLFFRYVKSPKWSSTTCSRQSPKRPTGPGSGGASPKGCSCTAASLCGEAYPRQVRSVPGRSSAVGCPKGLSVFMQFFKNRLLAGTRFATGLLQWHWDWEVGKLQATRISVSISQEGAFAEAQHSPA